MNVLGDNEVLLSKHALVRIIGLVQPSGSIPENMFDVGVEYARAEVAKVLTEELVGKSAVNPLRDVLQQLR